MVCSAILVVTVSKQAGHHIAHSLCRYNPCCPTSGFRFHIPLGLFVEKGPEGILGCTHPPAGDESSVLVQRSPAAHDWNHKRDSDTIRCGQQESASEFACNT